MALSASTAMSLTTRSAREDLVGATTRFGLGAEGERAAGERGESGFDLIMSSVLQV
jgi:hypothetical protein